MRGGGGARGMERARIIDTKYVFFAPFLSPLPIAEMGMGKEGAYGRWAFVPIQKKIADLCYEGRFGCIFAVKFFIENDKNSCVPSALMAPYWLSGGSRHEYVKLSILDISMKASTNIPSLRYTSLLSSPPIIKFPFSSFTRPTYGNASFVVTLKLRP